MGAFFHPQFKDNIKSNFCQGLFDKKFRGDVLMLLLDVPYSEKDEAKALGAKWNPDLKKWYVVDRNDYYKFSKWVKRLNNEDCILCDYFYIVIGKRECFKCKNETQVIGFGIEKHIQIWFDEESNTEKFFYINEDIHISEFIPGLPKTVYNFLNRNFGFRLGYSQFMNAQYYGNHCSNCGVLQGNNFLFHEVDSPFFVDSVGKAKDLKLLRVKLPYDIPMCNNIGYGSCDFMIKKFADIKDVTMDYFNNMQSIKSDDFYDDLDYFYIQETKPNYMSYSDVLEPIASTVTITTNRPKTLPTVKSEIGVRISTIISFPILILLSILLGIFSMNTYGKSINPNPTGLAAVIHNADEKIYDTGSKYIEWFFNAPLKTKIICLLIILATVIILTLLCKLDVVFQKLPGGRVLKEFCGYDFFEFQNHMRLLPAFLFAVYIMIWFGVIIFKENAVFELDHFDWFFKGYTPGQVITQIFAILILCTLFFVLLDSFISAGFIGGIFHLVFIFSANMLMMILSAFIGTFTVIALAFIVAIAIVLFFLGIIL